MCLETELKIKQLELKQINMEISRLKRRRNKTEYDITLIEHKMVKQQEIDFPDEYSDNR